MAAPSRVPPPPPTERREDAQQALAKLQQELRETLLQLERHREQVKGRDSHIAELQNTITQHVATIVERDAELVALRARPSQAAPTGDDLKRIRGIGPGYERVLHAAGIHAFQAIAAWTPEDVIRNAELLHTQPGRIESGGWVAQARELLAQSATTR
jgi:predicted flap endonuclease-1-like 5' DNA nuclease